MNALKNSVNYAKPAFEIPGSLGYKVDEVIKDTFHRMPKGSRDLQRVNSNIKNSSDRLASVRFNQFTKRRQVRTNSRGRLCAIKGAVLDISAINCKYLILFCFFKGHSRPLSPA